MKAQFDDLFGNYVKNVTNADYHDSIEKLLGNFEVNQLIAFCEENNKEVSFKDAKELIPFFMNLVNYAARTDSYFEIQKQRLLDYSLIIGGFAVTYITTILGMYGKNIIEKDIFLTIYGFVFVLSGCIITWIVYIMTFSPNFPHRKKHYSPFFFIYNVCPKFLFWHLSFMPVKKESQEKAIKSFSMDLATYIKRIKEITDSDDGVCKTMLTQVFMLFRTAQHKSKSSDAMRTILFVAFSIGLTVWFGLLIKALIYELH